MDNNIIYGFRNPSMSEDIGMSMIERQYPTNITPLGYTPNNVTNKSAYFEQPDSDTFVQNGGIVQSKRDKEYSVIKKVLVGLGVIALGFFAYKKGIKGIKNAYKYVKNLFTKGATSKTTAKTSGGIFDKCKKGYEYVKNHVKNLYTKSKNGISNLFNKIKPKVSP